MIVVPLKLVFSYRFFFAQSEFFLWLYPYHISRLKNRRKRRKKVCLREKIHLMENRLNNFTFNTLMYLPNSMFLFMTMTRKTFFVTFVFLCKLDTSITFLNSVIILFILHRRLFFYFACMFRDTRSKLMGKMYYFY